MITRLTTVFCFVVLLFPQQIGADELDFPSDVANGYSITELHHFTCLQDDLIRSVYLEYSSPVGELPCSVVYEKRPPERLSRVVLWQAKHSTNYCETRAREFVEVLRRWNWKCGLFRDVLAASEKPGSAQRLSFGPPTKPSRPARNSALTVLSDD